MPLFEYVCKNCNHRFEALVYGSQEAACPTCQGSELDQQFSTYSVSAPSAKSAAPASSPCGGGACQFGNGGGCALDS